MFSVIIPLYNKATYIEKAIQSVLSQTFQEFELIVVNDGSTDNPLPPKGEFGELSLDSLGLTPPIGGWGVINQSNQGVSVARNNGVKVAKYDYIAFLDADDWWEPTYLEEMKTLIDAFPEAGIYGSSYYLVKNGQRRVASIGVDSNFNRGLINYCKVYAKTLCMPLWTGATIIKKTIFNLEDGFKSNLKLGEDFDLWIRVALSYPVAFLNKPLADYNQDVELQSRAVGNLHNLENHILWNLECLRNEELSNPDLKQLLDNLRVYGLFEYFLSSKFRNLARQELAKVDWTKQPLSSGRRYNFPVFLLKIHWKFMKLGSKAKQRIIRFIIRRDSLF